MVTSASALLMILLAFRIPPLWWQVLESVWYDHVPYRDIEQ
jgi:hypothetical protein